MAKFKNLITGSTLETEDEAVIESFTSNPDTYEPLDKAAKEAKAPADKEAKSDEEDKA